MDWEETLDFMAADIANSGGPKTGDEFVWKLKEAIQNSLNDDDDLTFVGVPQSELDAAVEEYREMYF